MKQALLVTVLVLALAGCGRSDDVSDRADMDRADVQRTINQYFHATAFGDGETACGFLTAQARHGFRAVLDAPPSRGCETNIRRVARRSVPLHFTHVGQIVMEDDRAMAYVTSDHPSYSNSVVLVRQGGSWKLLYLPTEIRRRQLPRVSHPH